MAAVPTEKARPRKNKAGLGNYTKQTSFSDQTNETFAVPAVKAFKMDVYGNDGTTHICGTPSLSGIMGVDLFSVVIHDTPRTNKSVEQCLSLIHI